MRTVWKSRLGDRTLVVWSFRALWILLLAGPAFGAPEDFAARCADRAAIERVYHHHRLGNKLPFEQTLPGGTLERLVRDDLRKEATLKEVYGIEVTPALLDAEVNRINATTRAPDILAELKAALGNDPVRFARAVARPIVVERLLRDRFDNDDQLHLAQRRAAEQARRDLLAAKQAGSGYDELLTRLQRTHSNDVHETTWQLRPPPVPKPDRPAADAEEIRQRFGPNAQILSAPPPAQEDLQFYFADLPDDLQKVLRAQLRQAGDVSAVIELPGAFQVYVCKEKTGETFRAAVLTISKRSYEQWLADSTRGEQR
jgi:hypothetical protein